MSSKSRVIHQWRVPIDNWAHQSPASTRVMDERRKDALKAYREVRFFGHSFPLLFYLILRNCEATNRVVRIWNSVCPRISFSWVVLTSVIVRFSLKDLEKAYEKTENDIKAVQSVGQIIGEVMKQLDSDRCKCSISLHMVLLIVELFCM